MRDRVVEIFAELVSAHDGLQLKGKKMPYTSMNGNMFSFVDPRDVLCLRLSETDQAAFEVEHGTGDVIQHGSVMRGYVPVPGAMLEDMDALQAVFAKSVANAKALKPKPTTRKK